MTERGWQKALRFVIMLAFSALILVPVVLIFIISFKTNGDFMKTSYLPTFSAGVSNYIKVWRDAKVPEAILTSLLITLFSVAGQVLTGSLAAYALTKMDFAKSKLFSALFLMPLVFSIQTVIFPLFLIYNKLGLLNTRIGLILIYIATSLATCIFIFTKFLRSISHEISEAAQIDGAGHLRIYFQIMLPLTKAQISTIAVINGLGIWNDFFLPLMMFTGGKISTMPLTMYTFTTEYGMKWELVSADIILMMLPMLIIYFLLQRYIVEGVAAGAVKG